MRDRTIRMLLAVTLASAWAGAAAAAGDDRCVEPPSGLAAWWAAEGSAADILGGWHGALVGDTIFANGEVGEAFLFDGSGDYVQVADANAGDFGAGAFTVAFWMTSMSAGSGTYLIGKSHPDGGQGWDIRLDSGRIQIVGVNGWAINITSDAVIEVDQWHHVAVAGTDSEVTLFIDGVVKGTSPRQAITTAPNPLRFGFTTNFGGSALNGQLDEIQFFNRSLSAGEVQVLHESAPGGNCRPCAALPEGAVAWWRAEDDAADEIGANNGTLVNGVPFDDGIVDRAFVFNGTDDYVELPDTDLWDFGYGSFSMTAWFDTEAAGYRNIIRFDNGHGSSGAWGVRIETGGKLQFLVANEGGSAWVIHTSDDRYDDGSSHNVAAVRDADAGELRLFVDGRLAATPVADGSVNVIGATDAVAAIGAGVWDAGSYELFAGYVDEVAIFDRALSADEAAAIFAAGEQGICHSCVEPPSDLVSWWRGDGNAFDSGGANDGTQQNGATFAAGLVGQAISLPTGNDFVEVPHNPNISFGATEPMSIALWAYRATDDPLQHILSKRYDCDSNPWNYQMWWDSGDVLCFGSASGNVCTTDDKLPLQTWTYLAVSFDGSEATIYVNGMPEGTASISLGPDTNTPPLRFGSVADCDTLDYGFRGLLDEIELYDRALSRDEVLAVYRAGSFGRCTDCAPVPDGLEAWWRAEGDATDTTGVNDGTGMNGAAYGAGRVGRAFDLDNDASPDYVEVPHSASLDITGAFSVEGWVFEDELAISTVVVKGDANGTACTTSYAVNVSDTPSDGKINAVLYGSYPADRFISTERLRTETWHHVALTWDGSTTLADNVNLYIDGRHSQSWNKTNPMCSTAESLTIGAMKPPTSYGATDGRIDELSIYSAELTAAEVRGIVAAGSAGKCVPGDAVPEPFVFFDSTGHQLTTIVGTDPITVTGVDQPAPIAITACTSDFCWYAVNDGGWTTQSGIVENGDQFYVRQMTAATQDTTTDLTLSIGGVSDTFSATTFGDAIFSDGFETGSASAWSATMP